MIRRSRDRGAAAAVAVLVVLAGGRASAQTSALATLPEEPPEVSLYRLGPIAVNPRLNVPEIGSDSNVFNETTTPKQDFVVKLQPEVDLFADAGLLRFTVRSGTTFTYYHRHASERSMAEQVRGRVTARFTRLRPWLGGASLRSTERTSEIDARARRSDREIAAGVEFDMSPVAALTLSASRTNVRFADRTFDREEHLSAALDRTSEVATAGLRYEATPFTTVTFRGYTGRDVFLWAPARNARTQGGEVELAFSPDAVIRGRMAVGYRRQDNDDPSLASYSGFSGRGGVTTVLLWHAMLAVNYVRDLQYSFDRLEGYYVESGADVVYTQRVGGPFDVQVRVARHALDYSARR
jgi:hypothetical protein